MTGLRGNEPDLTGAEQKFMREEKQAIFSTAVGLARLRLQHGDLQGASDVLDDACDEAHVKHFDACIKDGYTAENVKRLLGPREQKVKRVPTGGNEPDLDATAEALRDEISRLNGNSDIRFGVDSDEAADAARAHVDALVGRVRDLEAKRDEYGDLAARRQAMLLAAEARVAQLETALRYIADYPLTGTERTLHIDFQGVALAALVSAGQGDTP